MELSESLFHFKSRKGREIFLRYPKWSDVQIMHDYINTLSMERTYIRLQGEEITVEDEQNYIKSALDKIDEKLGVMLLAFHEDELIGIAEISMKDKIEDHIGVLGISIAKDYRDEGIGTNLLECTVEQTLTNIPKLAIVVLEVYGANEKAIQVYKNVGFVEFGRLPKGVHFHGDYIEQCYMYKTVR